ncbi:MAG: Uma2 family endonuclease [Myxococcales bacterium]|nr:Uma2 family endonuclease [Myxococcales bacterium]
MPFPPRSFSIDEYHRLLDGRVLRRGGRTELLDGLIIERPRRTEREAVATSLLQRRLDQVLPATFQLRSDEALTLSQATELCPPFSVVSQEEASRSVRHPASATLVIEIAVSDIERLKPAHVAAYARAGVQELWLLDLRDTTIEVLWKPLASAYQDAMLLTAPLALTARVLPDVSVDLSQVFGS